MRTFDLLIALSLIFGSNLDFSKYLKIKEKSYSNTEKRKYDSYESSLYEPPYLKNKFYYNKTIPREKYSNKSLRGLEIKNNNLRKQIKKSLENKL